MITDIFLIIIAIPLQIILAFLSGITSVFSSIVPDSVYTSITTLVSYLGYFSGIFPIDTLMICISALIIFYTAYYTVKITLWVWGFIPYLGKDRVVLPDGYNKSASITRITTISKGNTKTITRENL